MRRSVDPNAAETSYRNHISSRPPRAEPAPKPPRPRTPPGPDHRGRAPSGGDRQAGAPADTNEETWFMSAAARSPPRRQHIPLVRTVPLTPPATGQMRDSRYTQGSPRPTGLSNVACVQFRAAVPRAVVRLRARVTRSDGSGGHHATPHSDAKTEITARSGEGAAHGAVIWPGQSPPVHADAARNEHRGRPPWLPRWHPAQGHSS